MLNIDEVKYCILMSQCCNFSGNGLQFHIWQEDFELTMSKRQKKKAPVVEEEPEVEVITKI